MTPDEMAERFLDNHLGDTEAKQATAVAISEFIRRGDVVYIPETDKIEFTEQGRAKASALISKRNS